jgi:hypothetical protein
LHDKTAALEKLARALGMFKENVVLDGKLHGVVPTIAAIDLPHHPKQWEAKETKATEVLYGGAAGDGARISTHLEDKLAPEMA